MRQFLPPGGRVEILDDAGHFVHIEQPAAVSRLVLDLVGRNVMSRDDLLDHNRIQLALHHLRARATGRPLLFLHGLGEASPAAVPAWLDAWTGPVAALDFTGHGAVDDPGRRRLHVRDPAGRRRHRPRRAREATVFGRGLGAFVALMLAGSRPADVVGAVLADGPGLAGGADVPDVAELLRRCPRTDGPPDPYALVELTRDLRPPDYAAAFVRLALAGSPLDEPITVAGRVPPAVAGGRRRRARRRPHVDPRRPDPLRRHRRRFARSETRSAHVASSHARRRAGGRGLRRDGAGHRGDPPLRDARRRHGPPPQPPPSRPHRGWEANDAYPVMFAAVVCVGCGSASTPRVADARAGRRRHHGLRRGLRARPRRLHPPPAALVRRPPSAVLERLAAAHELHHRYGGAPYGMLVPIVPAAAAGPGVSRRAGRGRPTSLTAP